MRKLIGVEHEQHVQEIGLALLGAEAAADDGEAAHWIGGFLGNRASRSPAERAMCNATSSPSGCSASPRIRERAHRLSTDRFDLPRPDLETQPYWDAAREPKAPRQALLQRAARRTSTHARSVPYCWSDDVEWEEASGRATLYTYSIVRRNDLPPFGERVPYVAAVVDLEEGPRMMTNVEGCDVRRPRASAWPLVVDFRVETDEFTIPDLPARRGRG